MCAAAENGGISSLASISDAIQIFGRLLSAGDPGR
jgi:hypothetical protein